jgi:hypothetical protein
MTLACTIGTAEAPLQVSNDSKALSHGSRRRRRHLASATLDASAPLAIAGFRRRAVPRPEWPTTSVAADRGSL